MSNTRKHIPAAFPQPAILLGDFNAHNTIWGSRETKPRGREVEQFIGNHNVIIMNNEAPTRIERNSETAIDLICSATIAISLQWSISTSPGNSDHCLIFITYEVAESNLQEQTSGWTEREAQWELYASSKAWDDIPEELGEDCKGLVEDIYKRISQASMEAIPMKQ